MRIQEVRPDKPVSQSGQVKLIEVTLPKAGGVRVVPNRKTVRSGQKVTWHFLSWNPRVKEIEVEFPDPSWHLVFPAESKKNRCKRKMQGSEGHIHGVGPAYPGAQEDVHAKYTVRGLDGNGKEVVCLDPELITPKP